MPLDQCVFAIDCGCAKCEASTLLVICLSNASVQDIVCAQALLPCLCFDSGWGIVCNAKLFLIRHDHCAL